MLESIIDTVRRLLKINPWISVDKSDSCLICDDKSPMRENYRFLIVEAENDVPDKRPGGDDIQAVWRIYHSDRPKDSSTVSTAGPPVKELSFRELRNRLLPIAGIKAKHKQDWENSYTEDERSWYIRPSATSDRKRTTSIIHNLVDGYLSEIHESDGLFFIMGGYGNGKTAFCRHYVHEKAKTLENEPTIPLLFSLNEQRAGDLRGFIETELVRKYQLYFSYEDFAFLVRQGVFAVFLDAFDQLHTQPIRRRIEADYLQIRSMTQGKGRVFLTCRDYFFQDHLQRLEDERTKAEAQNNGRRQPEKIWLKGFDQSELEKYFEKRAGTQPELEQLKELPAFTTFTDRHQRKPLLIRIVADHANEFRRMVEAKKISRQEVTDFDVFDLPYQAWMKSALNILKTPKSREQALRTLVVQITRVGFNSLLPLQVWLDSYNVPPNKVIPPEQVKQLKDDFSRLLLLDPYQLELPENPCLSFPYPPFLEFLMARFVVDDLAEEPQPGSVLRQVCLTPPARAMAVGQLSAAEDGPELRRRIEDSQNKSFTEVEYEASNCASLLVQAVRQDLSEDWKSLLRKTSFTGTVLREADFSETDLTGFYFYGADLSECDFSFCTLINTRMEQSNLEGARFNEPGLLLTSSIIHRAGGGGGEGGGGE